MANSKREGEQVQQAIDTSNVSDPLQWDPDPVVLISARSRNVSFPQKALTHGLSTEQVKLVMDLPGRDRVEKTLAISGGVNFLGTMTTTWALLSIAESRMAPKAAPRPDDCQLVTPVSSLPGGFFRLAEFRSTTAPDLVDPAKVAAGWTRVIDFLRTQEALASESDTPPNCLLFTTQDGAVAPELILCRLSEVFSQATQHGRAAYAYAHRSIRYAKHSAQLGALHDYAVRSIAAWGLVDAARQRAIHAGGASFTGRG